MKQNPENRAEVKPKYNFTYRDNNDDGRKIIFEYEAESILEADKKYQEKFHQDVSKQPHIGCSIEKILPEKPTP